MSRSLARHSPHTVESLITRAIACTASKSPFDAAGKPASMTSTRMRSSARAMGSFSSLVIDAPGLCSPSRMVVSKMIKLLVVMEESLSAPEAEEAMLGLWVGEFSARGAAAGRPARGAPGTEGRKREPDACGDYTTELFQPRIGGRREEAARDVGDDRAVALALGAPGVPVGV